MADITTTKINSTYTKIDAEPSVLKELSDHFRYRVPDYQFKSKGKYKWDGYVKLFQLRPRLLPSGLLRYLFDFARERGYTIAYDPDLLITNAFSIVEALAYIQSLEIASRGAPLEVRDYQVTAFAKAIRYKRLTMISPTSSGKSLIAYCTLRYLLQFKCKRGLLVVPTTSLVEQMFSDFADYSTTNKWPVDEKVQKVYDFAGSTVEVAEGIQLVISTWQSIYDLPQSWFEQFDFVIGDEAHTFSATCVGSVAEKLVKADYRVAMTGTTHGVEVSNMKMEGYFGPITKITTTKKLMDDGHIAELSIKSLVLKHPPGTKLKLVADLPQEAFAAEMAYIVSHPGRNRFIKNLVLSLQGNTLLLFQYLDRHGKVLHEMIQEKLGNESDRKLFFVFGGTDVEDREAVRGIVEKESNAIICASFGVFSTGVNIRNLHNIIFASPTKSKIRTLQSIGRGLRLGDDKTTATLYDLADDFREHPNDKPNFTLKHYAERMLIYHNEQFKVSHYKIDLD